MNICDLLIVFSKHTSVNAVLENVVFMPDKTLQIQLAAFLNDKVFIDDDDGKIFVNFDQKSLFSVTNIFNFYFTFWFLFENGCPIVITSPTLIWSICVCLVLPQIGSRVLNLTWIVQSFKLMATCITHHSGKNHIRFGVRRSTVKVTG